MNKQTWWMMTFIAFGTQTPGFALCTDYPGWGSLPLTTIQTAVGPVELSMSRYESNCNPIKVDQIIWKRSSGESVTLKASDFEAAGYKVYADGVSTFEKWGSCRSAEAVGPCYDWKDVWWGKQMVTWTFNGKVAAEYTSPDWKLLPKAAADIRHLRSARLSEELAASSARSKKKMSSSARSLGNK